MGKASKAERRAEREAKRAAKAEAERLAQEAAARRKRLMVAIPVLGLVVAGVGRFALDDDRVVGFSILVGFLLFLGVSLAGLGGSVQPRDGSRAGSIDFGNR